MVVPAADCNISTVEYSNVATPCLESLGLNAPIRTVLRCGGGMGLDPFFGVLWRSSTSFSSKRVESDLHSCPESYLSAQNIHGLEMLEIVDRTQKGKSSIALAV